MDPSGFGEGGMTQALEDLVTLRLRRALLPVAAVGLAEFRVDFLGFGQQIGETRLELRPDGFQVRRSGCPCLLTTGNEL